MAKAIFLEGIDGTGKSTLIQLLSEQLVARGEEVLVLREPGGTPYYQAIREHIHFSDLERTPLSDALTCAGGIAENIRQTRAALQKGTWVLTDRCYISNAVYQIAQGLDPKLAGKINDIATNGFHYDHGIILDLPLEVAQKRLMSIGKKKDRWETMGDAYFEKLRQLYLQIADKQKIAVVDASAPIGEVYRQICQMVNI